MIKIMSTSETIENVLEFWFGEGRNATEIVDEKSALWWSKDDRIDKQITRRFTATVEAVASGQLSQWLESPRGLLALIIITDQFPRNIYRNTPRAFSCDALALSFAKTCVSSGAEQHLAPIECVFAYLPFEHSEVLADQQYSVDLYQALMASVGEGETELFNGYCEFARKHYEIIKHFGRFPHRNQILGRCSSDEEKVFLTQAGSSF